MCDTSHESWLAKQDHDLARGEAKLVNSAAALRDLINQSRADASDHIIRPEEVALAYHYFRVASELFDRSCRRYVDTL